MFFSLAATNKKPAKLASHNNWLLVIGDWQRVIVNYLTSVIGRLGNLEVLFQEGF
jgi:hypothetical protein